MKKIAVTITTINLPVVIRNLIDCEHNISKEKISIDYIIIGDLKTPNNTREYLEKLSKDHSKNIYYFDISDQEKSFSKYKKLLSHLPVNSFSRRNLGDLFAYINGYDIVIRIDDDNFPVDNEFFIRHSNLGIINNFHLFKADDGWYNICEPLKEKDNLPFYPRGYPYEERWKEVSLKKIQKRISPSICAGLWVGDPDVDAITRLHRPVVAQNYDLINYPSNFALEIGTWSPINTQNTSYQAKLMPASFVSPHSGRYDDIFSGYFLRSIMDHMGDYIIYGLPLVNQVRNEHNLWSDLDKEIFGNTNVYELITVLKNYNFKEKTYASCYLEICEHIRSDHQELSNRFHKILDGMEIWGEIFINELKS